MKHITIEKVNCQVVSFLHRVSENSDTHRNISTYSNLSVRWGQVVRHQERAPDTHRQEAGWPEPICIWQRSESLPSPGIKAWFPQLSSLQPSHSIIPRNIWGSQSGTAEDPSLMAYDAVTEQVVSDSFRGSYSHAPRNDISFNDILHIRCWPHEIII